LKLEDYLFQGLQNTTVCQLLETTVNKAEANEIQYLKNMPDFLPSEALSLFLAKKYLSGALALKPKDPKS
jgi:hypothetical protein